MSDESGNDRDTNAPTVTSKVEEFPWAIPVGSQSLNIDRKPIFLRGSWWLAFACIGLALGFSSGIGRFKGQRFTFAFEMDMESRPRVA